MKYIRTKDGIYETTTVSLYKNDDLLYIDGCELERVITQADTIEELIQIGDIVFYWVQSYEKEHCVMITSDIEIQSLKYNAITKLLISVGDDYKCVAKGFPSFNLIRGRKYLVSKGELELL